MAYINLPPDLRVLINDLADRLRKLETAQRFTAPNVATDPTNPRKGDIWLNTTTNTLKIVDANGTIRTITLV
jgi:hypothetical protein